jgi:large subunit ribosomal protein L22
MAETTKREFKASARNVRMSARKARLVMDAVRGRDAEEAMVALQFLNKRASPVIRKLIESAVANAEEFGNREGIDIDTTELVIADAQVDEGPRMKRWRPRSRGMANPFVRYTCHMRVVLAERGTLEEQAKGRPAFYKPRRRLSKEQRLAKKGIVTESAENTESKASTGESTATEKPAKKTEAKAETATPKKVTRAKSDTKAKGAKKAAPKSASKSGSKKTEKKADKKAPAKKKK